MINKNYILFFVSLSIVFTFYNDIVFYKITIKETLNNKIRNENILNLKKYQNNIFNENILNFNILKENTNIFENIEKNIDDKTFFNIDLKNLDILNRITNSNNNISSEKNMAMNFLLNKQNDIELSWLNDKVKNFNIEKINIKSEDKESAITSLKSSILYQYMNIGEKNYLFENEKNIYKRIELTNRYLMSIRNVETSGEKHRLSVFSGTQALGKYQINGSTSRETLLTFLNKYDLDVNDIQNNEDFNLPESLNKAKEQKKVAEYFVNKMEEKYFETYQEKWSSQYKSAYLKDMNTFINKFLFSLKDNEKFNNEDNLLNFFTKYMTVFIKENETQVGQGVFSLITSENKMLLAKNFNQINNSSTATEVVEKTRLFYNAGSRKHTYASKVKKQFKNIINLKILNDDNLYRKKI